MNGFPPPVPAPPRPPDSASQRIRNRMISGILILLPLGITYLILKLFFKVTAGLVAPILDKYLHWPLWLINTVSIAVFVVVIYLLGVVATKVLGRRLIAFGEKLILKIPVLKSIYSSSKQVVETFSVQNKSTFKNVILVDFPRKGVKCMAFGTGTIRNCEGQECFKVFLPTTPNPTTGFFFIMAKEDVQLTNLSVEEGIKMIVSGGILGPDSLKCVDGADDRPAPGPGAAAVRGPAG